MNISFFLTTQQFRDRTKTETRRLGWKNLKAGQILTGVLKGQGLKKGERITPLGKIRVRSVSREPLSWITPEQVYAEGFPTMTRTDFIEMFCKHNKCKPDTEITRIVLGIIYLTNPN